MCDQWSIAQARRIVCTAAWFVQLHNYDDGWDRCSCLWQFASCHTHVSIACSTPAGTRHVASEGRGGWVIGDGQLTDRHTADMRCENSFTTFPRHLIHSSSGVARCALLYADSPLMNLQARAMKGRADLWCPVGSNANVSHATSVQCNRQATT